jgi:hypothetical protein
MERQRLLQLSSQGGEAGSSASGLAHGLEAGCRRCLQSAGAALSWTLAPVVVK